MDIWQILMTPFSWLLETFCRFFDNYGVALIVFTLVVKVILFPLSLKGKKSMIKMNLLNSQVKEIQQRCGSDRERYSQEVNKLYADNQVSPMGGCGWSLIPLAILMPLYAIIRRPLKYLMGLSDAGTTAVANALGLQGFVAGSGYGELTLAATMNSGNLATAKEAVTAAGLSAGGMFVINFNFLGLDLSQIPNWKFWDGGITYNSVGLFLLPVISAGSSVVFSLISMKTNAINKQAQQANNNASMRTMMIVSPLISLWIGFTMPAALCVYWIANNLLSMLQEFICGRLLKKDYEKAAAAQAERERLEKEEEKEERRRKAEERARRIEEAKLNKGKKKKAEKKKDEDDDKIPGSVKENSRVGMRQYARGRAYDPYRYSEDGPTPYPGEEPIFPPRADSRELKREAREVEEELRELRTDEAIEETILTGEIPAPETDSQPDAQPGEAPAPQAEESAPAEGGDDTKTDGESGK